MTASSRPVAGDHVQETPPDPVSGAEVPAQIVAEPEATAVGGGGRLPTVRLTFAQS